MQNHLRVNLLDVAEASERHTVCISSERSGNVNMMRLNALMVVYARNTNVPLTIPILEPTQSTGIVVLPTYPAENSSKNSQIVAEYSIRWLAYFFLVELLSRRPSPIYPDV